MLPDHSGATKVPDPSTIEVYTIWEKMCRLVSYFQFQLREVTFFVQDKQMLLLIIYCF